MVIKYTIIIILFFSFYSCKKNVCADEDALNFKTQNSKNAGSCIYYSDPFIGQYLAHDTLIDNSFFGISNDTVAYTFNINKYTEDSVILNSFFKCSDYLSFALDSDAVQILDNSFCDRQLQGYFYFSKDTVRYNCWYSNSNSTIHRWGVALKVI